MKRLRSLLPLILLIGLGVALFISGALDRFSPETLAQEQEQLRALISEHPVLAPLVHITVLTLAISTGIPGALVIILAGGILFGLVAGSVLSTIGLTLGALVLFFASRAAFEGPAGGRAPALVQRMREGYLVHPLSYTLFLRLVPFFPFGAVTVGLAWLRCPAWLFIFATAAGGGVMTAIETAIGAGIAKTLTEHGKIDLGLLTEPRVVVPVLGLAILALIPIFFQRLRRKQVAPPPPG